MDRLGMLNRALIKAQEVLAASAMLNPECYRELRKLPEEQAIAELAKGMLSKATGDISADIAVIKDKSPPTPPM